MNFVISSRGGGKTFLAKNMAIKCYESGEQMVYVRRTAKEMERIVKDGDFWADIAPFYPDYKFSNDMEWGYIDDVPVIRFIPLSTSLAVKSKPMPLVSVIVFDEYVIKPGSTVRYLRNENFLWHELLVSIFRSRDGWKAWIFGNNVSTVNPIFTAYGIELGVDAHETRFHSFVGGSIGVEFPKLEGFQEMQSKTRLGQMIKGTDYGDYAIGNKTMYNTGDFVNPKRPGGKSTFMFSITTEEHQEYGVWYNEENDLIYVDNIIDPKSKMQFVLSETMVTETKMYWKPHKDFMYFKRIKRHFATNKCYFKSQLIKQDMLDFIQRL